MTCPLCDGHGVKDYWGFAMELCECQILPPPPPAVPMAPEDKAFAYLSTVLLTLIFALVVEPAFVAFCTRMPG